MAVAVLIKGGTAVAGAVLIKGGTAVAVSGFRVQDSEGFCGGGNINKGGYCGGRNMRGGSAVAVAVVRGVMRWQEQ